MPKLVAAMLGVVAVLFVVQRVTDSDDPAITEMNVQQAGGHAWAEWSHEGQPFWVPMGANC